MISYCRAGAPLSLPGISTASAWPTNPISLPAAPLICVALQETGRESDRRMSSLPKVRCESLPGLSPAAFLFHRPKKVVRNAVDITNMFL